MLAATLSATHRVSGKSGQGISLEKALARLQPGDSLLLHRGEVFEGPIVLKGVRGGTRPTVVGGWGNGSHPVVRGTRKVDGWTSKSNGLWCAPWNKATAPMLRSLQSAPLRFAVWPETGWAVTGAASQADRLVASLPVGVEGAVLLLRPNSFSHSLDTLISQVQGGGGVRFADRSLAGNAPQRKMRPGLEFRLQGHPSLLKRDGDWTVFRGQLWMRSKAMPQVEAMVLRSGVVLKEVEGVSIEGIDVENVADFGFEISGTNVSLRDIVVREAGQSGIHLSGKGIQLESFRLEGMRSNGIESYATDVHITKGLVRGVALEPGWPGGYRTSAMGTGITVRGARSTIRDVAIEDVSYDGIKSTGPDAVIARNRIRNHCARLQDGGGIYLAGMLCGGSRVDSNEVAAPRWIGEERGVHLSVVAGIYLDERTRDCRVQGNRIHGGSRGIFLHNAARNRISGNEIEGYSHFGIALDEDAAARDSLRENEVTGNRVHAGGKAVVHVKKLDGVLPAGHLLRNTYLGGVGVRFHVESRRLPARGSLGWDDWRKNGFDLEGSKVR